MKTGESDGIERQVLNLRMLNVSFNPALSRARRTIYGCPVTLFN